MYYRRSRMWTKYNHRPEEEWNTMQDRKHMLEIVD